MAAPWTLEIGPKCPNFKFLVFAWIGFKFSGCVHISYMALPLQYFGCRKPLGDHRDSQSWLKLSKFPFVVFGRRSLRFSGSATIMRFRKVLILLRPILGHLGPRLKPHFRLSNIFVLLHEAVALIRSLIALVSMFQMCQLIYEQPLSLLHLYRTGT